MAIKVNHTNTKCCICGSSESYIKYIDYNTKKPVYLWYREYDKNYDGDWTGRYLCNKCWNKESPNSFDNIQKSLRDKRIRKYKYNKSNTCDRCREKLGDRVYREYDDKGYWTKGWLCNKCYKKDDNEERFIKDHKIGNLDPYSTSGKGYISETIVCKARGIKSLNIENDNWKSPIDHSTDPELGILQTKCALYNPILKNWHNGSLLNEYGKRFDHIILLCFDEYMKNVLRIYIIPKFELDGETTIFVALDWSKLRRKSKFEKLEKYRINNKYYNDVYHSLDENDLRGIRHVKSFIKSINE